MNTRLTVTVVALLTLGLAGCVGQFEVKQTEPIRVQIDGESEETRVVARSSAQGGEAEKSEFRIQAREDVETVTIVVECTKVHVEGMQPDDADDVDDTGNDTGNDTASPSPDETVPGNTTSPGDGNASGEAAIILVIVEDRDSGERLFEQTVDVVDIENIEINVDVRGKNNVVVVTQAIEGAADVSVTAQQQTEQGPGDAEQESGNQTAPTPTTGG